MTAPELLSRWKIDYGELDRFILKEGLPVCDFDSSSDKLLRPTENDDDNYAYRVFIDQLFYDPDLESHLNFRPEDIIEFERRHPELLERNKESEAFWGVGGKQRKRNVFPCSPGTKWEQIKIILLDDDRVRIETPQGEGRYAYPELKLADGRHGKPTMLWELVKLFAINNGQITSTNLNYDPRLPDTTKRLNKHFKQLFRIDDSIYQGHYKSLKGYKTKIFFSDQTKVTS